MPATRLLADKLKNIFEGSVGKGNTAMKLLPYCCRFQTTSVGTTTIFNLSFTVIKVQIGHQILKVAYPQGLLRRSWKQDRLI